MQPLVSVIIPVYNREKTILRALNSVLCQTYSNIEVIVVDDGSSDSSMEIVKKCADNRVRIVCLPCNRGASRARNRGIQEAKGEYIAFQDSDDEWVLDKLEKQMMYMAELGVNACYSSYLLYYDEGIMVCPYANRNHDFYDSKVFETLKTRNVIGTPTLIVKKDVFCRIGIFDENLKNFEDYEFAIRLVNDGKIGYIEEPLVKAYRMAKCLTNNLDDTLDSFEKILKKHSDYLDIKSLVNQYLKIAEGKWGRNINWDEFDRIILAVNGSNDKAEVCYKAAVQFFYENNFQKKDTLEECFEAFLKNLKNGQYAIYGAGLYGKQLYNNMKNKGLAPKCFIVTEQCEPKEIDGIPVELLADQINNDLPIIIAVSWEKRKGIIDNLLSKGITKFCVYPKCQ